MAISRRVAFEQKSSVVVPKIHQFIGCDKAKHEANLCQISSYDNMQVFHQFSQILLR